MQPRSKKLGLWLMCLLFWVLPALACNYPQPTSQPPGISSAELRQTMEAQSLPSQPAALPTAVPFPLASPVPEQEQIPPTPVAPSGDPAAPFPAPQIFLYTTQPGDTLQAIARRFKVNPGDLLAAQPLPEAGLLPFGQEVGIPNVLEELSLPGTLLPDSEVVYSPSSIGFDLTAFVNQAGGFLSTYAEEVDGVDLSGIEIVRKVAQETSTNPRLLLAFLEYRANWVFGQPANADKVAHPIGFYASGYHGLYKELALTGKFLNIGYYGWRAGTLTDLKFKDGSYAPINPTLNPGSVALQHLFSKFYDQEDWQSALYDPAGFLTLYQQMVGNPWERAGTVEPLFPFGLAQPALEFPFQTGERWVFTGGPHLSWNTGTPRGALDFAPATGESKCAVSHAWVTASAPGIVTRSSPGVVAVDLDGDGYEQTGWVIVYMHIGTPDRVPAGTYLNLDDPIGHPSCEGGQSTGTHVHIARKYNGEWIPADQTVPFLLSGWEVVAGEKSYEGYLVKDGQVIAANPGGPQSSVVIR